MNFHPISIEDVLTVSKRELTIVATKRESKRFFAIAKNVQISQYIDGLKYHFGIIYIPHSGPNDADMLHASISFSDEVQQLRAKFRIYVKSADFCFFNTDDVTLFHDCNSFWQQPIFSLTDVLNPEKKFIDSEKLTVHMKGVIYMEQHKQPTRSFLASFLWDRDDRDFVIAVGKECEAKIEIKIHKLILASRSPVFDAMLQTDMKEKAKNRLEIIDFDVEVVQSAVDYFYDRDAFASLPLNQLIDLLQFSEKYDIKDFKTEIEGVLLSHLFPHTICQIANATITFNSPTLKDLCIQTMIIYVKQGVSFANSETLDKDFSSEMVQKASVDIF